MFLLAAIFQIASAQYQVKFWTTDNDLPQNTVSSIAQTADGYLWLATLDGLVRFDGVRFVTFNKQNSGGISSNRFTELVIDKDGSLWAGNEEGGITRYYQGNFQTYSPLNSSATSPVRNLAFNNLRELVVFTDEGIVRWNGESFIPYTTIAGETKVSITLWDKSGAFWYTNRQIVRRFKDHQTTVYEIPGTPGDAYINKIFEDRRGRIWLGTMNCGLYVIENGKLSSYTIKDGLPSNYASPRIEDKDGNLWIVTDRGAAIISPDGKIARLTTEQGLSDNALLSVNSQSSVYEDREGNIWIGTLFRGLNCLSRRSASFYTRKDGLQSDPVYPIYEDRRNNIWIGGNDLTKWEAGKFYPVPGREKFDLQVTAIEEDHTGRLWFGNWGGALYYENGKFTDFTPRFKTRPKLADIHEDRQANLWFATELGLFRYSGDVLTRLTTSDGLPNNDIKIIHESADGVLWFGTGSGLSSLNNGRFTNFTKADGLASNSVRSIYEDREGVLWIGSYDGGLTRLKDNRFTRYTSNEGLYNDGVFQILEDSHGYFWMSCNRGIYRVSKQQLTEFADGRRARIESIALSKSDGLLETEGNGGQQPAGIKARDGKFWFPTQGGVAVIDPDSVKTNPIPPLVVIETTTIDGAAVATNDAINILPGKNNLEISYTGLSFVKSELVKFRYQLEGQDDDWIEAGTRRTAYYSYLPPGEYTFTVIAANSDGVWNTQGAKIKVFVQPPFYKTWWFSISALIVIIGAAYFLHRRRIERIERQRQAQENLSQQLIESQEAERQRIASELHDGLGQSLAIIKNRALLGVMSPDDRQESKSQFEEISRASSKALEEVREIAYNLRPHHLDQLGLKQSIEIILEAVNESSKIVFAYDIMSVEGIFQKNEEVIVYRIIQECVNNILKHSEATEASVLIHQGVIGITMTIEDDGRGFIPNSVPQGKCGLGLIGLEERVRILGGTLEIRSEPGNGTTIIIRELAQKKL